MINDVLKYDKSFTEATFLTKADHIFMMLLDGIIQKDLCDVKHYLSNETYNNFNTLIEKYNKDNVTRIFDETNVKSSNIEKIDINDSYINITVNLISRYMDYFINDDGEYISGINDRRIEKNHKITFTKRIDAKTLGEARRCNSCGNTLDINASGVCPYCNSTIDMSLYDYIITNIDIF